MIRDPSDGSVKTAKDKPTEPWERLGSHRRPTSAENWGLKSLYREPRKPKPAPTIDELRAHYARHNLAFEPKAEGK